MTDATIITTQTLFYDTYEYEFGDGFYPMLQKGDLSYKQIDIKFLYNIKHNCWVQTNEIVISGLDGDNGVNLLNRMNEKNNLKCVAIYNFHNQKLYPTR